jgi:hypothetical protein
VVLHPNQQWRFQASWLFSLWLASGAGAAALLRAVAPAWRLPVGLAAAALLALAQALQPSAAMAERTDWRGGGRTSDLELSGVYLPYLDGIASVGFAASAGRMAFFIWTTHEHCRCRAQVEQPWLDGAASRDEVRRRMVDWVATTASQIVVVIDSGQRDLIAGPGYSPDRMAGLGDAMAGQRRFERQARVTLPDYPAEISIWRLAGEGASQRTSAPAPP